MELIHRPYHTRAHDYGQFPEASSILLIIGTQNLGAQFAERLPPMQRLR